MNKALKLLIPLLVLVLALGYALREPLREFLYARMTQDMFVGADDDAFDPGPVTGSHFPGLRATYRGREVTLLEEFAGPNGTVFIASRSYDWCPYCMRQLRQLQDVRDEFEDAGIGLVAMSYDAPALQQAFVDRYNITIPLLSDNDALSVKTLGLLDPEYEPGDSRYGIAYPGAIVIDADGKVVAKFFLQAHSVRIDSSSLLDSAKEALGVE